MSTRSETSAVYINSSTVTKAVYYVTFDPFFAVQLRCTPTSFPLNVYDLVSA